MARHHKDYHPDDLALLGECVARYLPEQTPEVRQLVQACVYLGQRRMGDLSITGLVTYLLMLGWSSYYYRYEHPFEGAAAVQAILAERLNVRELNCLQFANLVFALARITLGVIATNPNERAFRPLKELMFGLTRVFWEYEKYLLPIEVAMVAKGFEFLGMRGAGLTRSICSMTPQM